MFENYKQMSADEKAQVKAIHLAIRTKTPSRDGNLAWAYVRGFKYRRVERTTRTQTMPDGSVVVHNGPNFVGIARILVAAMPELAPQFFQGESRFSLKNDCPLYAWAKDPLGAIPAPAREPKKPFVREQVA